MRKQIDSKDLRQRLHVERPLTLILPSVFGVFVLAVEVHSDEPDEEKRKPEEETYKEVSEKSSATFAFGESRSATGGLGLRMGFSR